MRCGWVRRMGLDEMWMRLFGWFPGFLEDFWRIFSWVSWVFGGFVDSFGCHLGLMSIFVGFHTGADNSTPVGIVDVYGCLAFDFLS